MLHRSAGVTEGIAQTLAEALAEALDVRDRYTASRSLRVAEYPHSIAGTLRLSDAETESIRLAAWLRGVGKIGISDAVLLEPRPLAAEEFGLVQLHPQIGRRILERAHGFEHILDAVELHHENYDGTGYPYGIAGEQIPLVARVIRVADAFDAMTTDRPYRPAFTPESDMDAINARSAGNSTRVAPGSSCESCAAAGAETSSCRLPVGSCPLAPRRLRCSRGSRKN